MKEAECFSRCLRTFWNVVLNKLAEFVIFRIKTKSVNRIIPLLGSWTAQNGKHWSDERHVSAYTKTAERVQSDQLVAGA